MFFIIFLSYCFFLMVFLFLFDINCFPYFIFVSYFFLIFVSIFSYVFISLLLFS